MAIFVTIYNYRAHNYFITIVMKFRNYFPSSNDHTTLTVVTLNILLSVLYNNFPNLKAFTRTTSFTDASQIQVSLE